MNTIIEMKFVKERKIEWSLRPCCKKELPLKILLFWADLSCINVLGHYSFVLNENVKQGELRPFNQPVNNTEDPLRTFSYHKLYNDGKYVKKDILFAFVTILVQCSRQICRKHINIHWTMATGKSDSSRSCGY